MSSITPKFTVVIPTRECADVLRFALQTVTAQTYGDLEIIVSDNCSQDDTAKVVRACGDPRVKYVTTGRRVSMSENWEFALSHVTGDWVTVLGDDDGLLPGAISKVAELVRTTQARAIRSRLSFYSWPSVTGTAFGKLIVPLQTGHVIRRSDEWLSRLLDGRARYYELPMIYNGGFVSVGVLDELRCGTGKVYRSCAPDVYSAVAIASVIPSYVFSHEPFAISGSSAHSTGRSFIAGRASGDSPANRFAAETNYPLHAEIPYCADGKVPLSIEAMVYESYLQSGFLRGPASRRHARQLPVILATAGKHRQEVEAWAEIFARQHAIDLSAARAQARQLAVRLKLEALPARVEDAIHKEIVGSSTIPIRNVHEASIVAASIRRKMPGLFSRVRRAVERLAAR